LTPNEDKLFDLFSNRVSVLRSEAQILRDYSMQIQDLYESQISVHQNDIMKILTIVTTLVLPLSLIAGWYGMNFKYMPELTWKYGYQACIGLSILVIVVSLYLFKKNKFL
jgi:magnesium transporter